MGSCLARRPLPPPAFRQAPSLAVPPPPTCARSDPGTKEYRGPAKKRLYLHHPEPDTYLSRRRVTRIIPPGPSPCEPEPPPPPEPQIEVIAVDVEPSTRSSKSSRSRSRSHSHRRDRDVYVERDRFIPVPVPVPVEPRYDTYRYVEAPRHFIPPPSPQPRLVAQDERERISISDHRRTREYYRR